MIRENLIEVLNKVKNVRNIDIKMNFILVESNEKVI